MKKSAFLLSMAALILVPMIISLNSCKKDDDNEEQDAPLPENYYIMEKEFMNTEDPCFVNVMFQVVNGYGKGISNLTTENFTVYEDNQAVSPTESALSIMKKDAVPYQLRTLLMIDNSVSVGSNLADIKKAAKSFVKNIESKQKIAVYVFSENTQIIQEFTSDTVKLNAAIDGIQLGLASTDLYGAIITGVSKWTDVYSDDNIEQGYMVLFTDGRDTQGSHTLNEALTARGKKQVFSLGLGAEIDPNALQQIGNAGYFKIENIEDLSAKFIDVQEDIRNLANSFYYLYYMSPKRGDKVHTLRLNIKGNANGSENGYITGQFNSQGFYSMTQTLMINHGQSQVVLTVLDSYTLSAVTFLPNNTPQFSWTTSDASVVTIQPQGGDNANAVITGVGQDGQTAIITCNDEANSLTTTISVVLED
ncbi:MAG: VWA domain-containing protein [Bacteroidetes bacterium]|nr:VWA domain-containing protein [Bacteroidota bacterium]